MPQKFYKTKPEIITWLDSMEIKDYLLIQDKDYGFVVNVNGDVELVSKGLTEIPVKFNIVKGYFDCTNNKLTSLTGCPSEVGGSFYCHNNKLTSLVGCPIKVGGSFNCHNNKLTSLTGCPGEIVVNFYCDHNELTNLMGISSKIKGYLFIDNNCIESLLYIPDNVGGRIYLENNPHTNLRNTEQTISYKELCDLHIIDKINHEKKLLSDNIKASPNIQDKKTAVVIHKI